MENKDIIEDDDFNITDHLIKKEGKPWPSRTYELKRVPEFPEYVPIKSCEPWYRRFDNKNHKRNNKKK